MSQPQLKATKVAILTMLRSTIINFDVFMRIKNDYAYAHQILRRASRAFYIQTAFAR